MRLFYSYTCCLECYSSRLADWQCLSLSLYLNTCNLCQNLQQKLIQESKKVAALNEILLDEKKQGKHNSDHVNQLEQTNKELKHLLLESNEKLQLVSIK